MYLLIVLLAVNPLYLAGGMLPLQAYNVSQIARTTPAAMPAGEALGELYSGFEKRLDQIKPGAKVNEIVLDQNTPTKSPLRSFLDRDTSKYSDSSRTDERGVYAININPNADRAYLAHELGHIASDQTDVGRMVRSARNNPKLSKALLAAGVIGAGSSAALTEGDNDLATSVAMTYAAAAPEIVDEFLATKNGLAIMDTAGMRASLGQRGRLAAGMLSYLGAPLLLGATANFAGNLVDDDQQTSGTAVMN